MSLEIRQGVDYWIVARNSHKPFDIKGRSRDAGGNVQVWSMYTSTNQYFRFEPVDGKKHLYRILNRGSGKYLEVVRSNLQQGEPSRAKNQLFRLVPTGKDDGYCFVESEKDHRCVDVIGNHKANGTNVGVYRKNGGRNQMFTLVPAWKPTEDDFERVRVNLERLFRILKGTRQKAFEHLDATVEYFRDFTRDPGQNEAASILTGGLALIGTVVEQADMAGSFLEGLFDLLRGDPALKSATFGSLKQRFTKNFNRAEEQLGWTLDCFRMGKRKGKALEKARERRMRAWHQVLKIPGVIDRYLVATLSSEVLPEEGSGEAVDIEIAAADGIRYQTWKHLTRKAWARVTSSDDPLFLRGDMASARRWQKKEIEVNPSHYVTLQEVHEGSGCSRRDGANAFVKWLGHGGTTFTGNSAPDDFCKKLFKDDGNGRVVRSESIALRKDVFEHWGLKDETFFVAAPVAPMGVATRGAGGRSPTVDPARVKRLRAPFAGEKRVRLTEQVWTLAARDPGFKWALIHQPHETLKSRCGLTVSRQVSVRILSERTPEYWIVLPYDYAAVADAGPDLGTPGKGKLMDVLERNSRLSYELLLMRTAAGDEELQEALLSDPVATIRKRLGVTIRRVANLQVHREQALELALVLPAVGGAKPTGGGG